MAMTPAQLLAGLTPQARDEPDSGIVKAAMYGMARTGVIPLWSGEGNIPTPAAFAQPAIDSLLRGETFYTWQRGIPELREALARYHARQFGRAFDAENFFVTSGGMQAIQTIIQMIAGEGDEIIIPTPAWPNYAGPLRVQGSRPVEVPMDFRNGRWHLDLDRLFDAITPRTRAISLNSPSNPVGWTATRDELIAVRDDCRKHGLWILGDEVYSRFYFGARGETRAPSFLDICDDEEMLLLANTFSKNWAMTGWRVGWLQAPRVLGSAIERIIQYNSSGTPAFLQRGCVAALDTGDDFVAEQVSRRPVEPRPGLAHAGRDAAAALRDAARRLLSVLRHRRHEGFDGHHAAHHRRGQGRLRARRHLRPGRRGPSAHVLPARSRQAGRGSGPLRPMAADEPPRMIARAGLAFSRKAY